MGRYFDLIYVGHDMAWIVWAENGESKRLMLNEEKRKEIEEFSDNQDRIMQGELRKMVGDIAG